MSHEDSGREVEEAFLSRSCRVEAVALGQHHPPARVKARVDNTTAAWADGARPPVGANGAEADIVGHVAGMGKLGDQAGWPVPDVCLVTDGIHVDGHRVFSLASS